MLSRSLVTTLFTGITAPVYLLCFALETSFVTQTLTHLINILQIGLFGKRRTGKSYTMRWLMSWMRGIFPRGYVFTNTSLNMFWQEMVPPSKVIQGYMPGVLQQIIDEQIELITYLNEHPEFAELINPKMFLILDDCVSQDLFHDPVLRFIFYNGRHLRMMLIMSSQYAKGMPPGMRENFDTIFIFEMHAFAQRKAVAEDFLGHYDFKTSLNVCDTVIWKDDESGQRQALVVDQSGNSPIDEMLYAAQAEEVPPFVLCCKEWWQNEKPFPGKNNKATKEPPEPDEDLNVMLEGVKY